MPLSIGASHTEVERWDAPLVHLMDRDEIAAYARSHLIPPQAVEEVEPPVTLTQRGCLVGAASIAKGKPIRHCRLPSGTYLAPRTIPMVLRGGLARR